MAYRILLRRDTSSNWEQNNPVLASGEPGYETDTGKLKIGDGVTLWTNLDYYIGATGPVGPVGPSGPTGPLPVGYASTGSNEFYGDQTINGMVSITGGVLMNPQIFVGNITIPDGYNAALIGPITITGSIGLTGSSVLAIL